jgi:hypothetical protein
MTKASPKSAGQTTARNVEEFKVRANPNPSNNDFVLNIETNSRESTDIRVFDAQGKLVKHIRNSSAYVRFGKELRAGVYIAEVQQGANRKTIKLIKF